MTGRGRALVALGGVVLAFAAGFGWQYVRAERTTAALAETRAALAFSRLENTLGGAAVAAQHGGYDLALRLASEFFTGLQQRIAEAPARARSELEAILAQRDATITLLSRAEPQSAEVLARMFVRTRVALGGPEQAIPLAPAPAGGP